MELNDLRRHDPSDMYGAIAAFADQAAEGVDIGRSAPKVPASRSRRVVILGMGGSAIGGDLLRSYVSSFEDNDVEVIVNRGYRPPHVDRRTLVVASSYSGNTEETLDAYEAARSAAGAVLVITTGGELGRRAETNGHRRISVPAGLQPRAALGYSFFPLVVALAIGSRIFGESVASATEEGIDETVALVRRLSKKYGAGPKSSNPAWALAEKISGSVPVIYSSHDLLDTVNLRWRGQMQENAKHLAFGNLLPEMNHNEINGWTHPENLVGSFEAVFLRDVEDHPRISTRIDITRRIIGRTAGAVHQVKSQGTSRLARMFSLIHLGDWVSYYLAVMNGVDPSPVPVIENLKKQLAKK